MLVILRYEDLVERPHSTFESLFANMDLFDVTKDGETSELVRKAVDFAIQQHAAVEVTDPVSRCVKKDGSGAFGIPEYSNTEVCGPNVLKDDIEWLQINHGDLLSAFGYSVPSA